MRKKRRRGPGPRFTWRGRILLLFAAALLVCVLVTLRVRPLMLEYGSNLIQYTATRAINDSMQDKIYEDRADYQELVQLERDSENRVTAVKTDSISMNRIKTEVVNAVYEQINTLEQAKLEIPAGTIFAPSWCSGMGPKVPIGMAGLGKASAEFISAFSQAGINQTRHNIILEVRADVDVLTPLGHETTTVTSQFVVTDTVIVGTVPEQYTYIDDTEQSLLGKINDYAEPVPKTSK